jgi:glycosyltransferase involved in cell wall biosynthesis
MTLAIDCRMINSSGVGVYLRECLPRFLESGKDLILLGFPPGLPLPGGADGRVRVIECPVKPFSIRELFFFPRRILKEINSSALYYNSFFNVPGGIKVPVYTTIHDIVFPDMPELISPPGLLLRLGFLKRAAARSKKIFTVSFFSKSRIEHYLGTRKPVIVTHIAVKRSFLSFDTGNVKKRNTLVFIGNIKKNKGLHYLIDAFGEARKEGLKHKLVIVGSVDNFRTRDREILQRIASLGSEAVEFTGPVPDKELLRILSEASLLVQPSLYEGFGLPPLEAMFLGTGALVSDIPVFREIYGDFPVSFFRAGDAADLKSKLKALLDKAPKPVELSGELRGKYTFEKTASIILRELIPAD